MNRTLFIFFVISTCFLAKSQNNIEKTNRYNELIKVAELQYNTKDYKKSANTYTEAFKVNSWDGSYSERYDAACTWALAENLDSAFYYLNLVAVKMKYKNLSHISIDGDLVTVRADKRWQALIDIIKKNKDLAEKYMNKPVIAILDTVYLEDQRYRQQIDIYEKKYSWESKEMQNLLKVMNQMDSINLLKVRAILDKHGWLGSDSVGGQGNQTLFLVIQHSDLATQLKYLPMMREAVKKGNARGNQLALLEDRVALGLGKKQIYGSQVRTDGKANVGYLLPLEDPDNVDKRRAEVGLGSLAEYLSNWQIKWDVEEYKKDLQNQEKSKQDRK